MPCIPKEKKKVPPPLLLPYAGVLELKQQRFCPAVYGHLSPAMHEDISQA